MPTKFRNNTSIIVSDQGIFRLYFGIVICFSTILIKNNSPLEYIPILVFVLLYSAFKKRGKSKLGKVFIPEILVYILSYFILILIFQNKYKYIVDYTFLIIGLGSGFTYYISEKLKKGSNKFPNFLQNYLESIILFTTMFLLLIFSIYYFKLDLKSIREFSIINFLIPFEISIIITLLPEMLKIEMESFILPFIFSYLIYLLFINSSNLIILNFSIGMFFALMTAVISFYYKLLTFRGSIAQFVIAVFIFGLGGVKWTIPILSFFVLSSILSKIRKKINRDVDNFFEKSEIRDNSQVLANGGFGAALMMLYQIFPSELLYYVYVSSLAAVCADTWATEIGTLWKTKTINILNLKTIDQGRSGGISSIGMFGAILGAFIIPISSLSWINWNYFNFILIVTISGVLGSIIDSVLGASFQSQFKCRICGKITERENHCNQSSIRYKGLTWIDNDIVNFITSIAGGIFFIPVKRLFRV